MAQTLKSRDWSQKHCIIEIKCTHCSTLFSGRTRAKVNSAWQIRMLYSETSLIQHSF